MNVTRIALGGIVISLLCVLAGCEQQHASTPPIQQKQPSYEGTIVAVGDSLTAGKGVNEEEAYPAQLENMLGKAGYRWRVVNAGISGETSSGTLSRVAWVLKLKPDIVILETGSNDGLRGIDPDITQGNIDQAVRILQENRVTVVLVGMKMVSNLGREFTRAFSAIYPAVARKHDLILIPFLLKGVAGDPSLNQSDGIHPTAQGYRIVAETVYPYVRRAIERKQKDR